ncbi:MAG TPA: Gfo/Idh/MocA family oxidoreductase, partial [Candidatus Lustribacter sp.]|nr:Gfo/Idh/MocA family oxidoreductase [Candidatus Lustribacter sp.]
MASAKIMRMGIAGLGSGAVNALAANPGLSNFPNIKLAAGADLRAEARDAFAARYGAKVYASVEAMCASGDIDAIYILTPNGLHAEHAILAANHGLQVIADKPMALSMEDCDKMIAAAERNGVRLLVGHSQSLDSGILKMAEIIRSGQLGKATMLTSTYYSEWLYRPRSREELDPNSGDGGITLRQGWIQLDILRILGGGMVRSVRGTTVVADPKRPVDGAYAALLEFEDGVPATAVFDGYGHFDSAELTYGLGLYGKPRPKSSNLDAHRLVSGFATMEEEFAYKNESRIGGSRSNRPLDEPIEKHQFFGLTIVSCERGALRQTPDGVMMYAADEWLEVKTPPRLYAEVELETMYDAWVNDRPLRLAAGPWGKATTEVCLALLQSARDRREVVL